MSIAETEAEPETVTGGKELALSLGITYRKLTHWVAQEYLRPEGGGGTGYPFRWPPSELEIAQRMGRLTAAGLQASAAARVARDTWPEGELAPGIAIVVTDPEETS